MEFYQPYRNNNNIYNNMMNHSNSTRNIKPPSNLFSQSLQDFHKRNYSPVPIEVPKAGIPLNYLSKKTQQSNLEDIKCPICYNLIWDIVSCNNCGNFFCQYCIEKSIKNTGNLCPQCRARPLKLEKSKGFKKFFNNIKIKCKNKNCKKIIDYFEYLNHLEKCEFRLYYCKNEGCNYKDTLTNIKVHSSECPYRIVSCEYCKNSIKKNMLENHIKNECPQNMKCPLCFTAMTRGYYNSKHQSADNNNIDCLKGQVEVYKKNITTLKDTINKNNYENQKQYQKLKEKNKSINDELKKEIKILKENETKYLNEIAQLKQELSEWNSSFKDIYNKLVLNKKEKSVINNKKDDEKIYLKSQENESYYNHFRGNSNYISYTPKLNNYKNFNFK